MSPDEPQSQENGEQLALSPVESRALGCLLEKEASTPEYYPLTLNALVNACNQRSNRNPAMELNEQEAREAIDGLREKKLAMIFHGADARVPRFKHTIENIFNIDAREKAILTELLLRGPQTTGELRGRCERMHSFSSLDEVEKCLTEMAEYPSHQIVAKLPRRPGQKEQRYGHLLGGEIAHEDLSGSSAEPSTGSPDHTRSERPPATAERLDQLESKFKEMREEVAALRNELAEFRRQFE